MQDAPSQTTEADLRGFGMLSLAPLKIAGYFDDGAAIDKGNAKLVQKCASALGGEFSTRTPMMDPQTLVKFSQGVKMTKVKEKVTQTLAKRFFMKVEEDDPVYALGGVLHGKAYNEERPYYRCVVRMSDNTDKPWNAHAAGLVEGNR